MQTVTFERERERRMFQLFSFLFKRPDLPANDNEGGDSKRPEGQARNYSGAYDADKVV